MIRLLKVSDQTELDRVLVLIKESQRVQHVELEDRDTPEKSDTKAEATWRGNLADAAAQYFVYEQDGTVAGYLLLRKMKDNSCLLNDLGVGSEYRRQGIGRQLVEFAIDWSRRQGLKSIRLITHPNNQPATATYRGAGMTESANEYYDFEKKL